MESVNHFKIFCCHLELLYRFIMGNKFTRRRDAPVNSAETVATEEKPAEEPEATHSGTVETQVAADEENLNVVVKELVTLVAYSTPEECVAESKEVNSPDAQEQLSDVESKSVAKDTPAPVQSEPLVLVSKPSPPEPEPAVESKPVAESPVAPEPAAEPVPEPEPTSNPEAEVEADPEPVSEEAPAPAEALEEQIDVLTQESQPGLVISSPASVALGVSDATPQLINTPPPLDSNPAPVSADKPSGIAVTEECQDGADVSIISTFVPQKSEETSESLERPMEVEAVGNLEQVINDVTEESVSGLLQNLALKENDLVADLIPTDVKIPDDTPITDMSTSADVNPQKK